MKQWEKPELKVFDIKMDENIAASGDESRPQANGQIRIKKSAGEPVDTIKTMTYYTDTNMIIETSYTFIPFNQSNDSIGLEPPSGKTANNVSNEIDDAGCRS